jgi:hypothetical protein
VRVDPGPVPTHRSGDPVVMAICLGGDEFDRSITDFSSGTPTPTTPTTKHSYRRPHRPHPHRRRNLMLRINKRDPLSPATSIAGRVRPTTVRHRSHHGAAAVSG